MQGVLSGSRPPLGEAGDHQVVGVVVLGVAVADLVEEAYDVFLAAQRAFQQEQREPGRRVGGDAPCRLAAQGARLVRTFLAAQRLVHGGEGEEHLCVVALRFHEAPVTGPGGGGGFLCEDVEAVAPAVPVVAGGGEQRAYLDPAALGQGGPGVHESGVAEGGVEGVRRGPLLAGTAQWGWGW